MATVKLKDEGERITFGSRHAEINSSNLTMDRYNWLIENHPTLADRFEVTEEPIKPSRKAE